MRFLLLAAALSLAAAEPPRPSVKLTSRDGAFRVRARFLVDAVPSLAWSVLTDYDDLPRFVPSLLESRVVRRSPDGAIVEQRGRARLLFFSHRFSLRLAVTEKPPGRIDFRDLGGGLFERYEGAWTVSASSRPCAVSYEVFARFKPSLIPRALARRMLLRSIQSQLSHVQAEIVRRQMLSSKGARGGSHDQGHP
ncbi:MAG: SRPBCC family protein [Elusimicrobia bacterium]|nr:SRPBCC family protein [Elusimicrobiota bacterium]MDE2425227.1 SRPBCC family protein [Elusimicrobiota bacterium]